MVLFGGNSTLGNTSNSTDVVQWVRASERRGTLDIIYSSAITIALCVWVSTYPNVPSPKDTWKHRMVDKLNLAMIGFLGPDLLFALALGQWSSARRSLKIFKKIVPNDKEKRWSTWHGFYADMGGFRILSNQEERGISSEDGLPVNSTQLLYLIEHKYIDVPSLTKDDIKNRSSSDAFSKVLVLFQVFSFSATELIRFAKRLPITTLELTALIFGVMMLATSAAWFQKPQVNWSTQIRLLNNASFKTIRDHAKASTHPKMSHRWYETPLDFVWKRGSFRLDTHWQYFSYLSHSWHIPLFTRLPNSPDSAWERIPSDIWHRPEGYLIPLGLVIQVPFCLSFLIAWNFHFSTRAEMMLWRFSAVYHAVFSLLITIHYIWGFQEKEHTDPTNTSAPQLIRQTDPAQLGETQRTIIEISKTMASMSPEAMKEVAQPFYDTEQGLASRKIFIKNRVLQKLQYWRNLSPDLDPDHDVSLRWAIVQFTITVIYTLGHVFIYLEDCISLRSQPSDVYIANNQFFPIQ